MRKIFLIALLPALFFVSGCKTSHGGNCNCPKFGQVEPAHDQPVETASVPGTGKHQ